MRKIKQTERPYLIFRYGNVGRTLYDSQRTLNQAKAVADRLVQGKTELAEVYLRGALTYSAKAEVRA